MQTNLSFEWASDIIAMEREYHLPVVNDEPKSATDLYVNYTDHVLNLEPAIAKKSYIISIQATAPLNYLKFKTFQVDKVKRIYFRSLTIESIKGINKIKAVVCVETKDDRVSLFVLKTKELNRKILSMEVEEKCSRKMVMEIDKISFFEHMKIVGLRAALCGVQENQWSQNFDE